VLLLNAGTSRMCPAGPRPTKLDAVLAGQVAERACAAVPGPPQSRSGSCATDPLPAQPDPERTAESSGSKKLLEDAQIKLSSVPATSRGLPAGRCSPRCWTPARPEVLARMAHGRMRSKIPRLREALPATSPPTTRSSCSDAGPHRRSDRAVRRGHARIESRSPPTPARWSSWMRSPARDHLRAGTDQRNRNRHEPLPHRRDLSPGPSSPHRPQLRREVHRAAPPQGNPWLAATLGEIVTAAARTDTFLGERYHRIAPPRGKRRAIVAWALDPDDHLAPASPTQTPAPRPRHGYYQARSDSRHRERDLIRKLERPNRQDRHPPASRRPGPAA